MGRIDTHIFLISARTTLNCSQSASGVLVSVGESISEQSRKSRLVFVPFLFTFLASVLVRFLLQGKVQIEFQQPRSRSFSPISKPNDVPRAAVDARASPGCAEATTSVVGLADTEKGSIECPKPCRHVAEESSYFFWRLRLVNTTQVRLHYNKTAVSRPRRRG